MSSETPEPHSSRLSPLALWHLLSLDAPSVALLWTWFIAKSCSVTLPLASLASMFVAVWMLYAADRLLDARALAEPSASPAALEERHHFHHQHRRGFLGGIAAAALLLAALLPALLPAALRLYSLLSSLLFAWFLLIHTRLAAARRLPKELAVGLFFPAAVFIPTVAREPALRLLLLSPALLFAAVCTLNCLYVYQWEHPADTSQAHWTTRVAAHHLSTLALVILASSVLCGVVLACHVPSRYTSASADLRVACIPAASALSALFLLALDRQRCRLSAVHLRAAADLALITPLFFAPFLLSSPR